MKSFLTYHRAVSLFSLCFFVLFFSIFQPRWGDLDINQHVNNVKYIGWILEVILGTLYLFDFPLAFEFSYPLEESLCYNVAFG